MQPLVSDSKNDSKKLVFTGKGLHRVENLRKEIYKISGEDVNLCFMCQKCSSGCPLSFEMDLLPSALLHAIRLNQIQTVIDSKTAYLCLSCMGCTTRCPQGLNIAKIIDSLKIILRRERVQFKEPWIMTFYDSMLWSMMSFGRVYELGMLMLLKLRTGNLFKDVSLGLKMLKKGKLKLLPSFQGSKDIRFIKRRLKTVAGEEI